jgi:glycine/D-amino acid oxidase-like deaminating enzyme
LKRGTTPSGRAPKCVVIGAGVLGVTTAYRLAQAGADVTVVDAGEVGGGTSSATFAQVNASYGGYWDYFDLRRAGVEGYSRLQQESGGAPWWHNIGTLAVYRDREQVAQLDDHLDRLLGVGYPAARVLGQPSTVDPALAPMDAERAYHFPSEGYVDVDAMTADLAGRGRESGAIFRTNDPVTAVLMSGEDVTGVRLRSGDTLKCDQLIVCCGRWTDEVLGLAGLESRYVAHHSAMGTPVPGLLVITEATEGSVNSVVSVDDIAYRPDRANRTMVWSGVVDGHFQELGGLEADPDVPERLAKELLTRAAEFVPALSSVPMRQAVVTARAMPADGLPIVGRPAGVRGIYMMLAHAAVTLAPALADLVVAEVIDGRSESMLDRFRPDRLVSTNA